MRKRASRLFPGLLLALLAVLPVHAQPSRPFQGIFSHTIGVPSGATVASNFDTNPYLAGITIKVNWSDVQPTAGAFDWSGIDAVLTEAGQRGKQVHLAILPGFGTPAWVYDAPYDVPFLDNITVSGAVGDAPLPWDPAYVALFDAVIDNFAAHLASHPYKSALTAVEITGHTYRGEEMHAPGVSTFKAQGFTVTYADVYGNWRHWIDKFEQAFPDQELILVISQTYAGAGTDFSDLSPLLNDISQYFVDTVLPSGRAVLQTDQLDGRKNSAGGVTNQRCTFFNQPPYTGADAVPNGHEMVGNFRTQPYRQGRPGMTVYNFKSMLNPYYMQIWSGNINDVWVAHDLLKEWYRYRNSTVAETQADLTARGLYLATSGFQTGSSAPQADDSTHKAPNATSTSITLTFDDPKVVPTQTVPATLADVRIVAGKGPTHGTIAFTALTYNATTGTGTVKATYTTTASNVVDTFRWELTDAAGNFNNPARVSNFAIATIEIGTVPHDPDFQRDPIVWPVVPTIEAGRAYAGASLAGLAADADSGATLAYELDSGPTWLAVAPGGALSGTPGAGDVGENRWVVKVTDETDRTGYATLVINVLPDTTAPEFQSLTASPDALWPVNHKLVPVTINAQVADAVDPAPTVRIISVSCSEPVNGPGDGNTSPDWEITGDLTLNLRAERAGNSAGRVYTIIVAARDASGNEATCAVTVTVPHDRR